MRRGSRRPVLVLALLAMGASAPVKEYPDDETEVRVEGSGYLGSSTGAWVCGPVANVRYGGGAGRVTVSQRRPTSERGRGVHGAVGGSVEHERITLVDPDCGDTCDPVDSVVPPGGVSWAGHARVGYGIEHWSAAAGVLAYPIWRSHTARETTLNLLPEVHLEYASRAVQVHAGLGSPTVTQIAIPGVYGGVRVPVRGRHEIEAYVGVYRLRPTMVYGRWDVVGRLFVTDWLALRGGGAIGPTDQAIAWEGSAGLMLAF